MTLGNPSTTLLRPFYHPSTTLLTKTLPSTLLSTRGTLASTSLQDWTTGTVRIGLVIRKLGAPMSIIPGRRFEDTEVRGSIGSTRTLSGAPREGDAGTMGTRVGPSTSRGAEPFEPRAMSASRFAESKRKRST